MSDDDILPEDDSVFGNLSNRPDNCSSDALMEDSFSEFTGQTGHTSTPTVSSSRRRPSRAVLASPPRTTRNSSRASSLTVNRKNVSPPPSSPGRVTRSSARAASPSLNPDSPSRCTRSASRSRNAVSPARADSPSRSTRSASRSRNAVSPARADSPSRSTRSASRSRNAVSPVRAASPSRSTRNPSKTSSTVRLKCPKCPSTLANKKTLDTHLRGHLMQGVSSRAPSSDQLQKEMPGLIDAVLTDLITEPIIGKTSAVCHDYCVSLQNSIQEDITGEASDMFSLLCDHFSDMLKCKKALFPTSITAAVYSETNRLLSNQEFLRTMRGYLSGLCDAVDSTINIVTGNFIFLLSKKVVTFTIKTMRGALADNILVRKKRSADNINDVDFRQLAYHIGGSIVHGYLYKGVKYSENSVTWAAFCEVLRSKFLKSKDKSNQCSEDIRAHTEQIDRGGLKHLSDSAFEFYLVMFDFLMSLEAEDGSLPPPDDIINNHVLQNDVLLCLWDVLVGDYLTEIDALDLLVQMTHSCTKVTMKGIMKRRLNENLKKAYDSVALRAKLAK